MDYTGLDAALYGARQGREEEEMLKELARQAGSSLYDAYLTDASFKTQNLLSEKLKNPFTGEQFDAYEKTSNFVGDMFLPASRRVAPTQEYLDVLQEQSEMVDFFGAEDFDFPGFLDEPISKSGFFSKMGSGDGLMKNLGQNLPIQGSAQNITKYSPAAKNITQYKNMTAPGKGITKYMPNASGAMDVVSKGADILGPVSSVFGLAQNIGQMASGNVRPSEQGKQLTSTAANVLGVASAVPGPQQPILAGLATLFGAGNLV